MIALLPYNYRFPLKWLYKASWQVHVFTITRKLGRPSPFLPGGAQLPGPFLAPSIRFELHHRENS